MKARNFKQIASTEIDGITIAIFQNLKMKRYVVSKNHVVTYYKQYPEYEVLKGLKKLTGLQAWRKFMKMYNAKQKGVQINEV